MDEKERTIKAIKVVSFTIFVLAMISGSIYWFWDIIITWKGERDIVELVKYFFTNFGMTILSVMLKQHLNKRHIKEIKRIVPNIDKGGEEMKEQNTWYGIKITKDKKVNKLVIEDTLKRNDTEFFEAITKAILEFREQERRISK